MSNLRGFWGQVWSEQGSGSRGGGGGYGLCVCMCLHAFCVRGSSIGVLEIFLRGKISGAGGGGGGGDTDIFVKAVPNVG